MRFIDLMEKLFGQFVCLAAVFFGFSFLLFSISFFFPLFLGAAAFHKSTPINRMGGQFHGWHKKICIFIVVVVVVGVEFIRFPILLPIPTYIRSVEAVYSNFQ